MGIKRSYSFLYFDLLEMKFFRLYYLFLFLVRKFAGMRYSEVAKKDKQIWRPFLSHLPPQISLEILKTLPFDKNQKNPALPLPSNDKK